MVPAGDVITVVVIEPAVLLRQALGSLLRQAPGLNVVGEAGAAEDVLPMLQVQRPHIVVFRFDNASAASVALLQQISAASDCARTIVLTSSVNADVAARCIEMGALGVVSCEEPADVLFKAIRKVHAGEMWLGRAGTATVITRLASRRPKDADTLRLESLTRREWDVVMLVTEGLKNKQIAQRLHISEATARNHLTSILDKLGLEDRFELAVYTFRQGLVACPQTPAILRRRSS